MVTQDTTRTLIFVRHLFTYMNRNCMKFYFQKKKCFPSQMRRAFWATIWYKYHGTNKRHRFPYRYRIKLIVQQGFKIITFKDHFFNFLFSFISTFLAIVRIAWFYPRAILCRISGPLCGLDRISHDGRLRDLVAGQRGLRGQVSGDHGFTGRISGRCRRFFGRISGGGLRLRVDRGRRRFNRRKSVDDRFSRRRSVSGSCCCNRFGFRTSGFTGRVRGRISGRPMVVVVDMSAVHTQTIKKSVFLIWI